MRAHLIKSSEVTKQRTVADSGEICVRASFRSAAYNVQSSSVSRRCFHERRLREGHAIFPPLYRRISAERLRCAGLHEKTIGGNGKRPGFDIDLYAAVLACPRDLEMNVSRVR